MSAKSRGVLVSFGMKLKTSIMDWSDSPLLVHSVCRPAAIIRKNAKHAAVGIGGGMFYDWGLR
jgi:hypothetical protein